MNIRKVAGSEMFDFLPAVFLVMLGRALYRRRSLFDPKVGGGSCKGFCNDLLVWNIYSLKNNIVAAFVSSKSVELELQFEHVRLHSVAVNYTTTSSAFYNLELLILVSYSKQHIMFRQRNV